MDFFVKNSVMLELKARTQIEQVHLAQALNYLEAYKIEVGLPINFGSTSLQFKRLTNEKKLRKEQDQFFLGFMYDNGKVPDKNQAF